MRISGVHIPPGFLRWAGAGAGVVVLGILIATVVSAAGLFGGSAEDQGRTVAAKVVTGAPCDKATARESVTFTVSGKKHQASFDGCGHAKNEPVSITLPAGPIAGNLVVHAADAAVGDGEEGEGLGLLLIVVSGMAGASYAFVIRRGPRTTRLPAALRLA